MRPFFFLILEILTTCMTFFVNVCTCDAQVLDSPGVNSPQAGIQVNKGFPALPAGTLTAKNYDSVKATFTLSSRDNNLPPCCCAVGCAVRDSLGCSYSVQVCKYVARVLCVSCPDWLLGRTKGT
jgi:hypothetical protein